MLSEERNELLENIHLQVILFPPPHVDMTYRNTHQYLTVMSFNGVTSEAVLPSLITKKKIIGHFL